MMVIITFTILSHCQGEPVAKVNLFPIILLNKSIKKNNNKLS